LNYGKEDFQPMPSKTKVAIFILAGVPVIITSIRSLDTWKKRYHLWVDRILEKITHKVTINAEAIIRET
jgi:hypothetical protein